MKKPKKTGTLKPIIKKKLKNKEYCCDCGCELNENNTADVNISEILEIFDKDSLIEINDENFDFIVKDSKIDENLLSFFKSVGMCYHTKRKSFMQNNDENLI